MDQSVIDTYERYWAEKNGLVVPEDDDERNREPHCPVCRRWWDHTDDIEEWDAPFPWHDDGGTLGYNPCWPCHEAIEAGGIRVLRWDPDHRDVDYLLIEPGENIDAWMTFLYATRYDINWYPPKRWTNREAAKMYYDEEETQVA